LKYRTLGRTDLRISEIVFGCGAASGKGLFVSDNVDLQRATIARALECGINYFDTAAIYGDGKSELALGRTLRALDAKPIVATKVALQLDQLDDIASAVIASVEGSLNRLDRNVVEVVYLHNRVGTQRSIRPNSAVGVLTIEDVLGPRGVIAGLEALKKRGLVRHFGYCTFGGEADAVETVAASGKFDALLTHYNLVNQSAFRTDGADAALVDYHGAAARAAAHGVGAVVLRVLEAGALADNAREVGTTNTALYQSQARSYDFLRDEENRLTPAAIRFALSTPGVSTVLVGIAEVEHVDAAAAASALGPLSAVQMRQIEEVWRSARVPNAS
jgi:aryl-alcohol dehydrogenase-like predicted oxidoreductase